MDAAELCGLCVAVGRRRHGAWPPDRESLPAYNVHISGASVGAADKFAVRRVLATHPDIAPVLKKQTQELGLEWRGA